MELVLLEKELKTRGFSQFKATEISNSILPIIAQNPTLPVSKEQFETLTEALASPKDLIICLFPIPIDTRDSSEFEHPEELSIKELTAPFAQINYYFYMTKQFKEIVQLVKPREMSKSECRIFVNSTLPEKFFTLVTHLCAVGKNNLLVADHTSSSFLIGGILFPHGLLTDNGVPLPSLSAETILSLPPVGSKCGNCTRCIEACPTGAISSESPFQKEKCLQYYSCHDVPQPKLKKESKHPIFYGCTQCQTACPRYITTEEGLANKKRAILAQTPSLPDDLFAKDLINLPEEEAINLLTEKTNKTALSPKWLEKKLLIRNLKKLH